MKNKVFCIGLNKTGTTSLNVALKILGFNSVHYIHNGKNIKNLIEDNYLKGLDIMKGLEGVDAILDWNREPHQFEIVKKLDEQYPNSKFIFTVRALESWLDSREKHVLRNQSNKRLNPKANITWLTVDRDLWTKEYLEYTNNIKAHFTNRDSSILFIDIIKGDGWELLCPFLDLPIPNEPFPKVFLSEKVSTQQRIKNYLKKLINTIKA